MFKKGNNIFSLLVIVLSVFMTSSVNIVNAADDSGGTGQPVSQMNDSSTVKTGETQPDTSTTSKEATSSNDTSGTSYSNKYVTSAQLTDSNGNVKTDFTEGEDMQAKWEFSIDQGIVKAGDHIEVHVPEQLSLGNTTDYSIVDENDKTKIIANVHINRDATNSKNSTVIVTFTPYAASISPSKIIKGHFSVNVSWDTTVIPMNKSTDLNWSKDSEATIPTTTANVTVKPMPNKAPGPTEVLTKYGGFDTKDPTIIHWTVRLNYRKDPLLKSIYTDTVEDNQDLIFNSIKAYPVTYTLGDNDTATYKPDENNPYENNTSMFKETKNEDGKTNGFTADFGDSLNGHTVMIDYDTKLNDAGGSINYNNTGDLKSNKIEVDNYTASLAINSGSGSGSTSDRQIDIAGQKIWKNDDNNTVNTRPNDLTINLLANGKVISSQKVTPDENNNWKYSFGTKNKFDLSGNPIIYTVQEEQSPDSYYTTSYDSKSFDITNSYSPKSLTVKKVWAKGTTSKPVKVSLIDTTDGKNVTVGPEITLGDNNSNWTHTWNNLYTNHTYTAKEDSTSAAKYDSITTINGNTVTITNSKKDTPVTPTKEYKDVTVNKIWADKNNKDGSRPDSIKVNLISGNQVKATVTLDANNKWKHTWTGLDKDTDFTVEEVGSTTGYTTNVDKINDNQFTITNTHTPKEPPVTPTKEYKDVTVNKIWNDKNNKDSSRPDSVKVNLISGGQIKDTVTLDANNHWKHTWTGLNKNTDFTVEEVGSTTGYTTNVDKISDTQFTITNTHTPGTPVTPTNPEKPTTPTKPVNPTTPVTPGTPSNPQTPIIPTNPSEPGTPSNPTNPNNPLLPTTPSEPVQPSTPTKTETGRLPQTGSKDMNLISALIGISILGSVATHIIRRKRL